MKLYINYNFCGYRWFVINDVFDIAESTIKLEELSSTENIMRIVKKMMLYDSYDTIFLHEENKLILAIRHIDEYNHTDPDGRKLSMAYIFEANKKEKDLLEKIILVYINHKKWLEKRLSALISSGVENVYYNVNELLQCLYEIKTTQITSTKIISGKGHILALISKWRNDTISNNLGIKIDEFVNKKHTMDEYIGKNLINQPLLNAEWQNYSNSELSALIRSKEETTIIKVCRNKCVFKKQIKEFIENISALFERQLTIISFIRKYYKGIKILSIGIILIFLISLLLKN